MIALSFGKTYFSKQEVCAFLDISLSTLNRLIASNQIPFNRLKNFTGSGSKVLIEKAVLDAWVAARIKPCNN